jgi:hypothetical protein
VTVEEFNSLDDDEKKGAIFDAKKVTERSGHQKKYELFQIDNFYVETKTSLLHKFKRVIKTFTLDKVPKVYAAKIDFLP